MSKKSKLIFKIFGAIVLVILIVGLSLNFILGSFVSSAVNSQLKIINTKNHLDISIETVKVNVFSTTIILKGIDIKPDSTVQSAFDTGNSDKASIYEFKIADLRLRGVGLAKILFEKHLALRRIIVKGISLDIVKGTKKTKSTAQVTHKKKSISIDSLHIGYFNQIDLSKIDIEQYSLNIINAHMGDTATSYKGDKLDLNGIRLDAYEGIEGVFHFNTEKLNLKLRRQRYDLKGGDYFLYFEKLDFSFSDSLIKISDFQFKPTRDKFELASSFKYTKEVFDVDLSSLSIHGLKVGNAIKTGVVDIDSIVVDALNIAIFKDKNQPWDYNKRPQFIQQKLKKLKQPIYIDKVIVKNSKLKYSDRAKGAKDIMVVDITNMNAQLNFVTSIRDSLRSGKDLTINLKGKLMDSSPLNLDIVMPYTSRVDTFYFSGSLGKAQFKVFNPAIYPAAGIKFTQGTLNSVFFSCSASPKASAGTMTMLYSEMEAEVIKKEVEENSKALTWIANAVIPTSNPSKKGKTTIAKISVDRVEYKGLGNLIWKSVQSGLVNTINPFGKVVKEDKKAKQDRKSSNKEEKKSSKREKRREKKEK